MTAADRLAGLAVLLPLVLLATGYSVVLRRRGSRWPWSIAVGAALIAAGMVIPWLPVAFAGVGVVGIDVYQRHVDRGAPRAAHGARHRHRREE